MPKPPTNPSSSERPSPLAARVRAVGNRRGFFAKSSMAIAGGAALATEQAIVGAGVVANSLHATGDDTLRVGLIGCGARGRTVAAEALNSAKALHDGKVELVAMADAYSDQLQAAYRGLRGRHRSLVNVEDRRFVGMNAGCQLLQCDVDLVILATPPVFRPLHFSAAVEAGKHVMLESFVALDQTGIHQVEAASAAAVEKKLVVGGGLPWRYEVRSQDFIQRIHKGAIGKIESIQIHLPSNDIAVPPRVDGMSRRDFELRNWRYFDWTGGLFNHCEQFHLLDLASWISQADGISQSATPVVFSRDGQAAEIEVHGTEGVFVVRRGQIRDSDSRICWRSDLKEPKGGGTRAEINAVIHAIRSGEVLDEAALAIEATRAAIKGFV